MRPRTTASTGKSRSSVRRGATCFHANNATVALLRVLNHAFRSPGPAAVLVARRLDMTEVLVTRITSRREKTHSRGVWQTSTMVTHERKQRWARHVHKTLATGGAPRREDRNSASAVAARRRSGAGAEKSDQARQR